MNIANSGKGNVDNADELSIGDIYISVKSALSYVKTKWLTVVLISFLAGLAGLAYSIVKKANYSAISTFVLEDSGKSGGLGQYAGLASLAGIDIGSGAGGGIFQGDNIIELYKSRLMIEKTLLSKAKFNNHEVLLIDRYIDFKKLRKKWKNDDDIDSINFNGNPAAFNRHQDSIITDLAQIFNQKYLSVLKPDKKLAIIQVIFTAEDELFAKEFNNKLVENVNDFYTITKTKKSEQNVRVLQRQADSVRQVLNTSISGVASAIDASPNANPQLLSLRVPSQKKQIDVQASTAVYSEIVKNLEISKITLRQEKPLIQIIDSPVLPLLVTKVGKVKGTLIGLVLGSIVGVFSLLLFRLFKKG